MPRGGRDGFAAYVVEQLAGLGRVTARAMFGGHGIYRGETIFGIVHGGRFYLKTDAAMRAEFEARGQRPFQPNVRQRLNSYYEVPADVLEDADELARWAARAVESTAARSSVAPKVRSRSGLKRENHRWD